MRFKLCSVLSILLLVGSNDARPSKLAGSPEIVEEKDEKSLAKGIANDSSSWQPIEPRSSSVVKTDSRTELKDLRYMDQSLRTVATQLLNVTKPHDSEDPPRAEIEKIIIEKQVPNVLLIKKKNEFTSSNPSSFSINDKSDVRLDGGINSDTSSSGSMIVGFGRPGNSKFSYFESSHPGQAMAITEEELERELTGSSSTRLITAHKSNPTTTGGISTWILLNPPTTTIEPTIDEKTGDEIEVKVRVNSQGKLTSPVEILETTIKSDVKTAGSLEKVASSQSTTPMERVTTFTKSTTPSLQKSTVRPIITTTTTERSPTPSQTTLKMEKTRVTSIPKTSIVLDPGAETTRLKEPVTIPKTVTTTRNPSETSRSTMRPKITTPRSTNVTSRPMATKLSRIPGVQSTKSKAPPVRKVSTKLPIETTKNPSTSKIEKVTFRPVHSTTTTTPRVVENQSGPVFLAKIKTSLATDSSAKPADSKLSLVNDTAGGINETDVLDIIATRTRKPTKTSNVLKVQLKKPTESSTSIEIQPIEVNPPVLRIEKIEISSEPKSNSTKEVDSLFSDDSPIDVKFDFNPEVTRIETESSTIVATTRRPHKRKKNKVRRRKPTTSATALSSVTSEATSVSTSSSTPTSISLESLDPLTELGVSDNTIQESKIAPESKITSGGTKNKKKQVQKPIGTQIYNFLSREVMPSFGVMSLVGLGLGLASYFLYPFSGAIARRNYVVEPSYKYSMDEYGGNYGLNEEEVFSKVLQGMTNRDGKYGGIKDYENNFYRYQQQQQQSPDSASHTTRRVGEPTRYSTDSALPYRPPGTTIYESENYRNTEFKYPTVSTTSSYYEHSPRKPDNFVGKKTGDRQFVVGNVPKEYGYEADNKNDNTAAGGLIRTTKAQPGQMFNDNYKFDVDPLTISTSYGQAEALKSNNNDDYEEIEITPSAVAVEHGPRSLSQLSRGLLRRRKRDSVIQLIPSRTEIEREEEEIEKEEPLSNEIFDIIDSVIPGDMMTERSKDFGDNGKEQTMEKKTSGVDSTSKQIEPSLTRDFTSQVTTRSPEKLTDNIEAITEIITPAPIKIVEKIEDSEKPTGTPSIDETTISFDSTSTTSTSTSSTTVGSLTIDEIIGSTPISNEKKPEDSGIDWSDISTTAKPHEEHFNVFTFVKKMAEVKLRLGVAIMKHASESFARYLGHVQKRINGEE